MVKYQFQKQQWGWCDELESVNDINDKHIDIVYKLDLNSCPFGKCKTNCTANPYCLNGLGEKKLITLIQKESTVNIERSEYFRNNQENEYAGLVNLGATCYINTYLQVNIEL